MGGTDNRRGKEAGSGNLGRTETRLELLAGDKNRASENLKED